MPVEVNHLNNQILVQYHAGRVGPVHTVTLKETG